MITSIAPPDFETGASVRFGDRFCGESTTSDMLGLLLTPESLIIEGVKTQPILYKLILSNVGDVTLTGLEFNVAALEGDTLYDLVEITGIACDSNFRSYELLYTEGRNPGPEATWTVISWSHFPIPTDSILFQWDTSELLHGPYTIKLVVKDRAGRVSEDTVELYAGAVPHVEDVYPDSARAGSEMIITGGAFWETRNSSYVSFGGIQATEYTYWSDTEIRVIVPTGVFGQMMLTVTTAAGTSSPVPFTVMKRTIITVGTPPPVQYSDMTAITAILTDEDGLPLEGRTLTFSLERLSQTLLTGPDGKATWAFPVNLPSGSFTTGVVYEGETLYVESTGEGTLTVARETLAIIYSGDTLTRSGESVDQHPKPATDRHLKTGHLRLENR